MDLHKKIHEEKLIREEFTARYGHARRPMGVNVGGKFWMAHAGGIYEQVIEGPYNFVDALHDHALHFFGEEFLSYEEAKPFEDRHPAIQWMHSNVEASGASGTYQQDGNGAAWHRFAYDLYTIRDNSTLEQALRLRLLDAAAFQSARFELKVAAICSTAGFDLQFEDESDNRHRHPEFIGVDRIHGGRIAVEAKCRHRKGVLGFGGGIDRPPGQSVDVRKNVLDAFAKKAGVPFYVFVDPNLPPGDSATFCRWEDEIRKLIEDLELEGYFSPCPANAILFMNDPSHYIGGGPIGAEDGRLWVRCYEAPSPALPHPHSGMIERLLIAHKQRVAAPTDFFGTP